jgi:hypothetical protein
MGRTKKKREEKRREEKRREEKRRKRVTQSGCASPER